MLKRKIKIWLRGWDFFAESNFEKYYKKSLLKN